MSALRWPGPAIGAAIASRSVSIAIAPGQDVSAALREWRDRVGSDAAWLFVALMPPLAQVRRIELPRMSAEEVRRVINRSVSRHFPDARTPQAIAARRANGGGWIVAAAPQAAVSEIYETARQFGWQIAGIVPAHAAWAKAAGDGVVAVVSENETTLIDVARGEPRTLRRARKRAMLPREAAHARIIARDAEEATQLARRYAPHAIAFDLVPEAVRTFRTTMVRRVGRSLVVASVALLVLSAGVALWGEHRELNAVRAQRAELRPRVQEALWRRDTLVEMTERTNAIAALQQSEVRWSAVIARVAEALPSDAFLTAFRVENDSVSLEGQASNAAGVFAAMRAAPGFDAVRASAPVRQEGGPGQPVVERFAMGARVSPRAAERGSP